MFNLRSIIAPACHRCPVSSVTPDSSFLTIPIIGQPNSGKSTFFNALVGYRVETANYPGTTVTFSSAVLNFEGCMINIVDLPGTYTLIPIDKAEEVTLNFLLRTKVDGIIQVAEATALKHALSLTLELMLLGIPIVLVVNMIDEAKARGIHIDTEKLSEILGIPVVPAVAIRNQGTREALREIIKLIKEAPNVFNGISGNLAKTLPRTHEIFSKLFEVIDRYTPCKLYKNKVLNTYRILRLLADPENIEENLKSLADSHELLEELRAILENYSENPFEIFFREKLQRAESIAEQVTKLTPKSTITEKIDEIIFHPVLGKLVTFLSFALLFVFMYFAGNLLSGWMEYIFQPLENTIPSPTTPWDYALKGLIEGFLGGVEIVLPYAIPLMLILALLEDSGYLPRLAYVADSFFRFLGLSGRAVIPFITGYGCTVPAIMGLRSIPDERERRLAALLVPLVPCSARTVVLLALLVPLIGPVWGFGFYLFNLLVVAVVGKALERILRLRTPGLIMAIPPYRVPSAKVILWKIFLRMKDFFTWAWPILIVGSVALELGGYYNVNSVISSVFKWFTDLLHLPKETTIPLLFGLLKKELAVPMFYNAIEPIKDSVTFGQKLRFSMFTLFYIPCISTIAVIWKEFGGRWALLSSLINLVTATAVAMLFLWIR